MSWRRRNGSSSLSSTAKGPLAAYWRQATGRFRSTMAALVLQGSVMV